MYGTIKFRAVVVALLLTTGAWAQKVEKGLEGAYRAFEKDPQLQQAMASLYVVEATSGDVVFDRNSTVGLAPASTQKVITAATAYSVLGKDFRYRTEVGYRGSLESGALKGMVYVKPSGDPTLGSWRWAQTRDTAVLARWTAALRKAGINSYGGIEVESKGWEGEAVPDGWIWQDVGNYYGAGAWRLNWRENQFDIVLRSGNEIGDPVSIVETVPRQDLELESLLRTGAKGSGDQAYVYFPQYRAKGVIRGTIPVGESRFTISAAHPAPVEGFSALFSKRLQGAGLRQQPSSTGTAKAVVLYTETSPSLDSIIYWFLRRSINLYGEALIRTLAFQKGGKAAPSEGTSVIRNFWKDKGIAVTELNIVDGSGLSPLNRVTTHAQVHVLRHARGQDWFKGFYEGMPEYNNMKMKSGTINGVKGFCGYHRSKEGKEYIFSFLVNNYNGSASSLVQKMYKVLDELK